MKKVCLDIPLLDFCGEYNFDTLTCLKGSQVKGVAVKGFRLIVEENGDVVPVIKLECEIEDVQK